MPTHVPLPDGLEPHFAVARGLTLGAGKGRLRGPDLVTPFHGVRAPAEEPVAGQPLAKAVATARSFAPLMRPHHLFSHTTAALLWGCPLPRLFETTPPLHVTSLAPARAMDRRDVIGHRIAPELMSICWRFGLRVADPASTFLGLATVLGLDDLVAVGDFLVLDPVVQERDDLRPYIELESLRAAAATSTARGARNAVSATQMMRQRVESPRETAVRLLLMRAGLPEPEVNPDLYSESGLWLGRGDLVFRRWKVLVEYDGDQHRTDTRQYESDISRVERFVGAGWMHLRIRNSGLGAGSRATVNRVTAALKSRGWRG